MDVLKTANERSLIFGKLGAFQKSIENVFWKDLPVNKNYDDSKQFLLDLWASGVAIIPLMWLMSRQLIEERHWDGSLIVI